MPFQGLESMLRKIEQQYQSPEQRHWRLLNQIWPRILGEKLAAQTRPMNIRSQVLQVAVANPVLVQTLMFERSRLLKKLTAELQRHQIQLTPETTIRDFRFSTLNWHQPSTTGSPYEQFNRWDQHPCQIDQPSQQRSPDQPSLFRDPVTIFERWSKQVQDRYHAAPVCPQCKGPTLAGELERWGICSLCYSHSQMSRPDASLAIPLSEVEPPKSPTPPKKRYQS